MALVVRSVYLPYYQTDEGLSPRLRGEPEGEWVALLADPEGRIVAHSDLAMIGKRLQELHLFDAVTAKAPHDGNWATAKGTNASTGRQESMRIWEVGYGGMTLGSGWYSGEPGG